MAIAPDLQFLKDSIPVGSVRQNQASVTAALQVVGINFKTADLHLRSRAGLVGDKLYSASSFLANGGAAEWVVLSTCNRTEVYFVAADHRVGLQALAHGSGVDLAELEAAAYSKSGREVADHLFQVACGLDSALLGESEIVAQIKYAWKSSANAGTLLSLLFSRALIASKRVRTETSLCRHVTSIASVAIREASRNAGGLKEKSILLLGAGQLAQRVAKELHSRQIGQVTILNRTASKAEDLASQYGFGWDLITSLEERLKTADVVFATATAPKPLIDCAMVLDPSRLVFVDLGIPANVAPEGLNTIPIGSLEAESARNASHRLAEIPSALAIIEAELLALETSITEREPASTIKALVEVGDSVRERTLEWAFEKLPNLTEKERGVVVALARRITIGMLTAPIEELKKGALSPTERSALERAFRVNGAEALD